MAVNAVSSNSVSSLGQPAATKGSSTESLSKLAGNFDDFLKLLIVQLRNQDPTSPLDTNQFTQQIVSFTNVEQQINTNKKLEQLIGLNQVAQNSTIVSFVGKNVEVEGNLVTYDGQQDVGFSYNLDSEKYKKAFIAVRNMDGDVVFSGEGTLNRGRNNVTWQGVDNDGNEVVPGIYDVSLSIQDQDGNLSNSPLLVRGTVFGVEFDGDVPQVIVNTEKIPLEKVKFVGV